METKQSKRSAHDADLSDSSHEELESQLELELKRVELEKGQIDFERRRVDVRTLELKVRIERLKKGRARRKQYEENGEQQRRRLRVSDERRGCDIKESEGGCSGDRSVVVELDSGVETKQAGDMIPVTWAATQLSALDELPALIRETAFKRQRHEWRPTHDTPRFNHHQRAEPIVLPKETISTPRVTKSEIPHLQDTFDNLDPDNRSKKSISPVPVTTTERIKIDNSEDIFEDKDKNQDQSQKPQSYPVQASPSQSQERERSRRSTQAYFPIMDPTPRSRTTIDDHSTDDSQTRRPATTTMDDSGWYELSSENISHRNRYHNPSPQGPFKTFNWRSKAKLQSQCQKQQQPQRQHTSMPSVNKSKISSTNPLSTPTPKSASKSDPTPIWVSVPVPAPKSNQPLTSNSNHSKIPSIPNLEDLSDFIDDSAIDNTGTSTDSNSDTDEIIENDEVKDLISDESNLLTHCDVEDGHKLRTRSVSGSDGDGHGSSTDHRAKRRTRRLGRVDYRVRVPVEVCDDDDDDDEDENGDWGWG